MTRRQIEREANRADCTCDNVCNRGHHHRLCKAWRAKVIVIKRFVSGFTSLKRFEKALP